MIWVKVASGLRLYSNADGTEKATALAVQNFGLKITDGLYAIVALDRSSANAKIGARHDEGPDTNSYLYATHSTPNAVATLASVPRLLRGQTSGGPLLPYFAPTILVAGTTALESVTADVWVGGKPF